MNENLVSVIIPCYNQAKFLSIAIDSVLKQSYINWECIIVNDGSQDNTEEIAKSFVFKDKRIRYIKKENNGLVSARNEGIDNSKGEIILPLDADDKIAKDYLLKAINYFVHNNNVKIVYCKAQYFGVKTGDFTLPPFDLNILATTNLIFSSAFFKKSEWKRVGGYDIKMNKGLEDWEFWINILKDEKDNNAVFRLDYIGFFYQIKDNSMFLNMSDQDFIDAQNYISLKHSDFIYRRIGNPILVHKELQYFKGRIERIEELFAYKLYKRVKRLFFICVV